MDRSEEHVSPTSALQPDGVDDKLDVVQVPGKRDVEKNENGVAIHPTTSHGSQLPMSKARTIALVITLTGAAFLNTLSVQAAVI
ncbi:hypothetical protein LTR33_018241, partial [Friedmanniomyces endolithicus]